MPEGFDISTDDFAGAFKRFLDQANERAPAEESVFLVRLRSHFGDDPAGMPVVGQGFGSNQHADVQVAIDAYLEEDGRSAEILGISADTFMTDFGVSISQLLTPARGGRPPLLLGPVEHVDIGLAEGEVLTCVQRGLYLIEGGSERLAVLLSRTRHEDLRVEVMAPVRARAEEFLAQLRKTMRARSVYRGRVLSLASGGMGSITVHFHTLPDIDREQIVLPEGLLDRVERHTVGFTEYAEKLLEAGRHLKRGLLLHGARGPERP